jgi:hypothetical protein
MRVVKTETFEGISDMKKISLTDGNGSDGAFCPQKMAAAGVDNLQLSNILNQSLSPLASLLKDGCGFGLYINGDDGSVVGLKAPDKEDT